MTKCQPTREMLLFFRFLAGLAVAIVIASCAGTADPSDTMLRIRNDGSNQLQDLEVEFPDTALSFVLIGPGATTDYQRVPGGVYAQAAFRFTYQGASVAQPVDDWVGEVPLSGQRFTYNLRLVTTGAEPSIGMVIVKDQ